MPDADHPGTPNCCTAITNHRRHNGADDRSSHWCARHTDDCCPDIAWGYAYRHGSVC